MHLAGTVALATSLDAPFLGLVGSIGLILAAGAGLLSLLPPGAPGLGERGERDGMVAATLMLALANFFVADALTNRLVPAAAFTAAPLAVALLRRALGPGALRPRRPLEPSTGASGWLALATAAALAVPIALAPDRSTTTLAAAATLALVGALSFVHRAFGGSPRTRAALILAAIAAVLWLPTFALDSIGSSTESGDWGPARIALGAAAVVVPVAFAAVFRLRAERRCLWIAAIGVATAALAIPFDLGPLDVGSRGAEALAVGPRVALTAAGLVALVLAAPTPSRRRAGAAAALASALVAAVLIGRSAL